jgi:hypothetical protein
MLPFKQTILSEITTISFVLQIGYIIRIPSKLKAAKCGAS